MASPLHRAIRIVISQFVPQSSEMSKPVATVGGPVINLYNVGTVCNHHRQTDPPGFVQTPS